MGSVHADGKNDKQPEVIEPHLVAEALQCFLYIERGACLGECFYMFPERIVIQVILLTDATFFCVVREAVSDVLKAMSFPP